MGEHKPERLNQADRSSESQGTADDVPVGLGGKDVALTKDALFGELRRVTEDLIAQSYTIEEQAARNDPGAIDTGRAMAKGVRQQAALMKECVRQGYGVELHDYLKTVADQLERSE